MTRYVLLFLFMFSGTLMWSQDDVWASLSMVRFEKYYDPTMGFEVEKPVVGPVPLSMNGKELEVSGFFIPLTGKNKQSHFMLSRYPESMCYFCGGAGPESAMQVFMKGKEKVAYSPDKITVKGTLRVNDVDAANLIYTLEDATLVKQ